MRWLSALIVGIFYLAFRTGLNLRSREPNLTLAQVLAPALPGLVLLYELDSAEAQAALVLTTVVPLLYGTLDLSMGSFIVAVMVYSIGYLVVIFSHGLLHTPGRPVIPQLDAARVADHRHAADRAVELVDQPAAPNPA